MAMLLQDEGLHSEGESCVLSTLGGKEEEHKLHFSSHAK